MTSSADLRQLVATLASRAAEVATALLGKPNRQLSNKRELRFGRKGSLAVVTYGTKAGSWYDYENDVGGDLLDLIRREHNGSFRAAIQYAHRFIDHLPLMRASYSALAQCQMGATEKVSAGNQRQRRALELWEEALPTAETLAARLLAKRGIVEFAISSEVL